MRNMGEMHFRTGGYTGVGGTFLGGWNQLSENTQTFTLYKCDQCGKVDFYEPQNAKEPQGSKKKEGSKFWA
jgi:hypothetical protein